MVRDSSTRPISRRSSTDQDGRIAIDAFPNPNAYVIGVTSSTDFPTTPGAFQSTYGGGPADNFVAKIAVVECPSQATGRVTGGGSIDVAGGGIGTFGFIVNAQTATGQICGELQYVNHASGAEVHSMIFDSLGIAGNTATFGGRCTNNGAPCSFTVKVTDIGEPGTTDSFMITVDAGPPDGAL